MTSFNTLFNRMFQQKSKTVYLIYLIQLFASFCLTILLLINSNGHTDQIVVNNHHESVNIFIVFMVVFAGMMFATSFLANFVYWIISAVKNEKIVRSQTWRLIPIDDTKFLLSNFTSAFLTYVWLCILEFLTALLASLPILCNGTVRDSIFATRHQLTADNWKQLLGILILTFLFAYAWYSVISLLNLSSRSIIDFLPIKSSKIVTFIIRVIIIFIILWLLFIVTSNLSQAIPAAFGIQNTNSPNDAIVLFLAFDIIISLIDAFLLSKFVEAKQN